MSQKTDEEKQNAIKFARSLVRQFGRVQSKEILDFMLTNQKASKDIVNLALLSLNYLYPDQTEH